MNAGSSIYLCHFAWVLCFYFICNRKQPPEERKPRLLLRGPLILDFRCVEVFVSFIKTFTVLLIITIFVLQEAEARAAAAEEREQSVNERLSQTLSRTNVLEAQVLLLLVILFKYGGFFIEISSQL